MIGTMREDYKVLWDSITVNLIKLGWCGEMVYESGKAPWGSDVWHLKESWNYQNKAKGIWEESQESFPPKGNYWAGFEEWVSV